MAWNALAAFSLFVALLQVRAEVECYYDAECGQNSMAASFLTNSASDCCLLDLTLAMSYHPDTDPSKCHPCIVIGFNPNNLTIDEEIDPAKKQLRVELLSTETGLKDSVKNGLLNVTVQVNSTASTAKLGVDFKFNDGNQNTTRFEKNLLQLIGQPEGIPVQAINDNDTGEIEHFVVEVIRAELRDQEEGQTIQVFAGNSMTVNITDDDIIHVGFEVTEYHLDENKEYLTISFTITESIPGETHFKVRPMTYKDYDDEYPELKKKYPDIKPVTLSDEYDQAESTDFNSAVIHFTIPANSTQPNRTVTINVVDDDLLEPAEEGFRLLLEVDEPTQLSEVIFRRQTALFRIDNTDDKFEFGFVNDTIYINDTIGTFDRDLHLGIVKGRTEIPINITFTIGDKTTAELGVDYRDFRAAQVNIDPPENFTTTGNILSLTVNGDDIFEPDEFIEATLDYDLFLPKPFKPKYINDSSGYNSVVDPPPTGSVTVANKSALIVIKEGIPEIDATLSIPRVVQEGDSFLPLITVSHLVNATFNVYIPSGDGTAGNDDYLFEGEYVNFGPTITMNTTSSSVVIATDNLVEPNETFKVVLQFISSPSDIEELLNLNNPNETVTIIDDNTATIGFLDESITVNESAGVAVLTVAVKGDQLLATNAEVRVSLSTSTDTADESDFTSITDTELVFSGDQQQATVSIDITNDDVYENLEKFTANLVLVDANVKVTLSPLQATVSIENDDPVEIGFKNASYSVSEDYRGFSFEVEVKNDRQFAVPILFTLTDTEGEALRTFDYDAGTMPQQLQPGQSSVQHVISIVNDDVLEPTQETFTLNLQTSQPLVSVTSGFEEALVTITDNDNVTIGFRYDMYTAAENTSELVCVDITEGSLGDNRNVRVMLQTMDMTATAPDDYEAVSKELVFTHQTTVSCVDISIKGDETLEDDETFIVTLTSSDPFANLNPEEADVKIRRNGTGDVMVGFEQGTYVYDEADGLAVVDVILVGDAEVDVTVSVNGGPSTQTTVGPDKVVFNDIMVTFTPDGPKKHSVSTPIVDDDVALEDNETITVDLTILSPSFGVKLGLHKSTEVIIEDNEDEDVTVSFKHGQYLYNEGDGMAVVEVTLVGKIAVNVTVSVNGGPSTQTTIGTDRVVFDNILLTFTPNGATELSASASIIDDRVALEDNEIVPVRLTILSPPTGVELGSPESTVVTIVDNDDVFVNFGQSRVEVAEAAGSTEICVKKNLQTIPDLVVGYAARDGTAVGHDSFFIIGSAFVGSDYVLMDSSVTIPKNSLEACFDVFIVDDSEHETNESFFLDLVDSEKANLTDPSTVEVVITDTDPPPEKDCILSSSLVLETFPNENGIGHNLNISEGCERQLVTSCDDALDLEIRVDFFANDFSSTKVAILYNGATVIINEDLSLYPASSPIDEIDYHKTMDKTSVSIEEILLIVSRSPTDVTISTASDSLLLGGLCGNINGTLYFPKCTRTVSDGESLGLFKERYRLKPADQLLRGERSECGLTTNDTVVGDPLMTVPIYAPGFSEPNLHLCYEIHGAADEYFNFVSDSCTSVNAHYVEAPEATTLNIIDSMSFLAVDNQHACQRISVDVVNCTATVNGHPLPPMSRKRHVINSPYEKNGISVRSYKSRVRISVPNCADNSLVMWVICQRQPLQIPFTDTKTSPVDMIKFEITRGLNLKETSHGLLGQFWNIPVDVVQYTGALSDDAVSGVPFYTVNVEHPLSKPRNFTGFLYELSWEFESKQCLYVGNNQGGPIGEVIDPNDSVIEGSYEDYITTDAFETDFKYAVFENHVC